MTAAILFAREPVAGKVKTRMHSHLSPQQTATVYSAFLQDSLGLLEHCDASHKVVASADAEGLDGLRLLLDPSGARQLSFVVQQGTDLGLRMEKVLEEAFEKGAKRVVILGTDSPSLPIQSIDNALAELLKADVVLGPCVDGGYYLIGVTAKAFDCSGDALFRGIDWSTGSVLQQTVAAISNAETDALGLKLLAPWYDVDHPQDAAFLRAHLEALSRAGERVADRSLAALRGLELPPPS